MQIIITIQIVTDDLPFKTCHRLVASFLFALDGSISMRRKVSELVEVLKNGQCLLKKLISCNLKIKNSSPQ